MSVKPVRSQISLSVVIGVLVFAIIALHATSFAFPIRGGGKGPRISLTEVLVWVTGGLWLFNAFLYAEWHSRAHVPRSAWLLILLAFVSFLFCAGDWLLGFAELVKFVTLFAALYFILVNVLTTRERLRTAIMLWMLVVAAVVVWGLIDYCRSEPAAPPQKPWDGFPYNVAASFADRNVLSGYLALVIPFAWGMMIHPTSFGRAAWLVLLIAVSFVVMLAGGPWIAALAGIAVISFVRGPRNCALVATVFVLALLIVVPLLPRNNIKVLGESIFAYSEQPQVRPVPLVMPDNAADRAFVENNFVDKARVSPRYIEAQAALKFLTPGFGREVGISGVRHLGELLFGVGIGNYQQNIGRFYQFLPKTTWNNTEPDTHCFYLVLAVSTGIPAALAFLCLIGGALRRAGAAYRAVEDPFLSGVALGCIGSLTSLLVVNVFTSTVVHGVGPAMILVLALTSVTARLVERNPRAEES
jgi:hypothetical protein